jgi:hypothetical protein
MGGRYGFWYLAEAFEKEYPTSAISYWKKNLPEDHGAGSTYSVTLGIAVKHLESNSVESETAETMKSGSGR